MGYKSIFEWKSKSLPDCETYKSSRDESRFYWSGVTSWKVRRLTNLGTPGITGYYRLRVHIETEIRHLDVDSS